MNGQIEGLVRRINRLEAEVVNLQSEQQGRQLYVANVCGKSVVFDTSDAYTRRWFFPRYQGGKLHEPAAIRWVVENLEENGVFVDVGAHVGYFAIIAASACKLSFAIEPQEAMLHRIRTSASINHFEHVTIVHAAASDTPGFARVPRMGSPRTRVGGKGTNLVPAIALDQYFMGAFHPSMVKIDVEGFEAKVLAGACQLLERGTKILLEVHPRALSENGTSVRDVVSQIKEFRYDIFRFRHRDDASILNPVVGDGSDVKQNEMLICLRL